MGRLKRKVIRFNVDADIEHNCTGDILKTIDEAIKKLNKETQADKEFRPASNVFRKDVVPILEVIGKKLQNLDILQKIDISKIISLLTIIGKRLNNYFIVDLVMRSSAMNMVLIN